ncbi:CBS domain-containing protein [Planctomycetota bacterium]
MATSQTELQTQVVELAEEAYEAFCGDISGMFGIDIECTQQDSRSETVKGLKKTFKKPVAVNCVKSEGTLSGTFQLIFDRVGLFTLSGVIVMLPEQKILENTKRGGDQEASEASDAIGEMGNLLVGSWDRIFREELEGHSHFVQTKTFIGDPWSGSEGKIQLDEKDEFTFIPYEMTIGDYPVFNCGVIFPNSLFGDQAEAEEPAKVEEAPAEEPAKAEEAPAEEPAKAEEAPAEEPAKAEEAPAEEPAKAEEAPAEEPAKAEEAPAEEPAKAEEAPAEEPAKAEEAPAEEPAKAEEAPAEEPAKAEEVPAEEPAKAEEAPAEPAAGSVSESIQKMTQSSANLPGEHSVEFLTISASDIMQKDVPWCAGEDSVQQVQAQLEQTNTGYVLVGSEDAVEGIVSKSDILGAVSVYLRPLFSKWHRPLDDATLQIKVKWIMIKSVHTVKAETPLSVIMDNMSQFSVRALPVIDQQGKIVGIVTALDIFKALLNTDPNISIAGKTS